MTLLSNELVAAYETTFYTIQAEDEVITFRIGRHSPSARAWLSAIGIKEAGFITAFNPFTYRQLIDHYPPTQVTTEIHRC